MLSRGFRKCLAAFVISGLTACVPITGMCARGSEQDTSVYQGTLNGNLLIGLALVHDSDKRLHRSFFYRRDLKDFAIHGEYTGEHDIVLRQYNATGAVIGVFQLHFRQDQDGKHFPDTLLEGYWTDPLRTGIYPVSLSMTHGSMVSEQDEIALDRNAQAFYFAVLKGDKEKAARYVRYPLRINVLGRKLAHNKTEFLRDYDQIFTHEYLACIKKGVPHHMFHKGKDAMIGGGVVWFDEKGYAKTLNSCNRSFGT